MNRRRAPSTCAQCGADIPPKARACPECGADERTGWDEQSVYDGLDLPEEPAHPPGQRARRNEPSPVWMFAALLLIVVLGLAVLGLWR